MNYNSEIPFHPEKVAEIFGIENGRELLSPFFNDITIEEYDNHLEVTDPEAIIQYARGITDFDKIVTDLDAFKRYIHKVFSDNNDMMKITKSTGLFKALK